MTDNEALNDIAETNRQIENNTYNLVEQMNQQLALYDTPILEYLASGEIYQKEILNKQEQIVNSQMVIALGILLYVIYYFVMRCLK